MEYLLIFIFIIICIYLNRKLTGNQRKFLLGAICAYLIVLMGFRYRVGIDTINYSYIFENTIPVSELFDIDLTATRIEPAYLIITSIIREYTNEFWPVQIIMAAITNICVFIFIYRYCKNPFVGIFLYSIMAFFYFTTEILRESAAVGIFLLNYENFKQRKWGKYYLLSFLSIAFHYSAFIIWVFPFIRKLKLNLWFIILCAVFIFITPFIESFNRLLEFTSVTNRLNNYIDGNGLNMNWRISQIIKNAIPAIIGLIIYKYKKETEWERPFILMQILFTIGTFAIPIVFQRFINYTLIFTIVFLANLLSSHRLSLITRQCLLIVILLSQSIYWSGMYAGWIPYVSIFEEVKIPEREEIWEQRLHR